MAFSLLWEVFVLHKGLSVVLSLSSLPRHPWSLCPGCPHQTALPAGGQEPGSHREESHIVKDMKTLRHWSDRYCGPTTTATSEALLVSECPASSCSMGKAKESLPQTLRGLVSPSRTQKYIPQVDSCGYFQSYKDQEFPAMSLLSWSQSISHVTLPHLIHLPHYYCWLEKGVWLWSCQFLLFPQRSLCSCAVNLQLSFEYLSSCPQLSYLCLVSRFLI